MDAGVFLASTGLSGKGHVMREIKAAVVTAKISEANKRKLDSLIGEGRITYFEPFSYPEMLKMAGQCVRKLLDGKAGHA